ncbi:HAD-IIA family hydrolase [Evansella tamaricis]|uniref:HAD-IIA family hydrolase n=1 Tax=Evansella tamaricis TaxID=2069301 RepID=A0ABS6JJ30_9BACI|nr:HAD-IIA family hydrolase [Evansella tamaricis]MBU9713687.1 HAD-IIA family hydrolase [Evansella tamaricis]
MNGLIIDLDGTVYSGNTLIPGAREFIESIQIQKIPYLFVTNNSYRNPEDIAGKLIDLGINAKKEDIYTSSLATVEYIKHKLDKKRISVIGGERLKEAFQEAGYTLSNLEQTEVIIQGVDPSFTYETLEKCVNRLLAGADYILTNPDLLIPIEGGFSPGAGSIAAAIQSASQVKPKIIGKPSSIIMEYAIKKLGLPNEKVIVVGDNLLTDMHAGYKAKCQTAWIMTGLAPQQKEQGILEKQAFQPDFICENLKTFLIELEAVGVLAKQGPGKKHQYAK